MNRTSLIILLLAVLPNFVYAGQGTIRETDSQIIVEYEGDANEVAAGNIVREKEEKLKELEDSIREKEVERVKIFTENSIKLKEERRAKYNGEHED